MIFMPILKSEYSQQESAKPSYSFSDFFIDESDEKATPYRWIPRAFFSIALLCTLFMISWYNFLLFHLIAEMFSIIVAGGIFIVAWNTRRLVHNHYFIFLGMAYFFIGGLDFIHTISYKGMGFFQQYGANLPTQLWILARLMESISLLVAPVFFQRRLNDKLCFLVYLCITSIFLASIFYFGIFPDCYIEGQGLTPFKIVCEYLISVILAIAGGVLFYYRDRFDPEIHRLMLLSIAITIAAELFFTFYINVYGLSNLIGHFCKIISFYLIYRAIVETGLQRPYRFLFRELQRTVTQYRILAENIEDVIWVMNEKFDAYLYISPSIRRLIGYAPEEMIKIPLEKYIAPDSLKTIKKAARNRLIMEKENKGDDITRRWEVQYIHKDGPKIWVESTTRTLRDDAGKFKGVIGVTRNIEHRKKIERELEKAKEFAESANKMKSAFLTRMTHELRTPLNAISGYIQVMQLDKSITEKQRNVLDVMHRNSDYLLTLINDMLDVSKIESSTIALKPVLFNLSDCLKEIVAYTELKASQKNIDFIVEIQKDIPVWIRADKKRLCQILSNLLTNAVKYTETGSIRFKVKFQAPIFTYSVEDTGIGIPKENLEDIFSPFASHGNDFTNAEGLGLGLAISRRIIRSMGSELHVHSEPRRGSLFWFDLNVETLSGAESKTTETGISPALPERLIPPPREELEKMSKMAMVGDIKGIKTHIENLLHKEEIEYRDYAEQLLNYSAHYQLNEIKQMIEKSME